MRSRRTRCWGWRSGFAAATKEYVFYTDGDAQYDPWEMSVLWERRAPGVDLVNGYKISRSDPLHRIVIGRVYHHAVKLLFGLKVRDVDCDFRLIRRRVFDTVKLEKSSGFSMNSTATGMVWLRSSVSLLRTSAEVTLGEK